MPQAIINSIGVEVSIKVGIDISNASTLDIRYTKPDGTVGKWQLSDGVAYELEDSEHYVRFTTTLTTQIDESGTWNFQVYAVGFGYELYGTKVNYKFSEKMDGSF